MIAAQKTRPYDGFKRAADFITAAVGLIVLSPIQLSVAIAVAVKLGRPVLFKQDRPGRDGVIFKLYKFRSMKDIDESRELITDEQRITTFGSRLRSTSLDELPTLWNVLKGDMSIVGPRPLLVRYLDRYTLDQTRRHEVRPGVTGLAQVGGRNGLSWGAKFALDVEYVDRRSLSLDALILLRTFTTVIRRDGISAAGHVTMEEFGAIKNQRVISQCVEDAEPLEGEDNGRN